MILLSQCVHVKHQQKAWKRIFQYVNTSVPHASNKKWIQTTMEFLSLIISPIPRAHHLSQASHNPAGCFRDLWGNERVCVTVCVCLCVCVCVCFCLSVCVCLCVNPLMVWSLSIRGRGRRQFIIFILSLGVDECDWTVSCTWSFEIKQEMSMS